ncbi:MAG: M20 family metallo-hydrolase [Prolixibacteraceae bacterium]|nr:M20 family metallo-hydrolase [Prolixibacteraceae bacterium]MBN2772816.1 M20 family metallo-hydrolase [Prolixibacteraceae bacterium]
MQEYIDLLKNLIRTPSFSKEENKAAELIRLFLAGKRINFKLKKNNTWAFNKFFREGLPTILLDSHIDTVKPAKGWTVDPFYPLEEGDKITGLGSNDAGGPLMALLATFVHFYEQDNLPYNLIFAATAEEENSGNNGIESILTDLPEIDFAILGEPTGMDVAIAERGLLVLDCYAKGKSGHAARDEGENAIYKAMEDIKKLQKFKFEKVSDILGAIKISVTQIEAGTQHNVVPDLCHFVADVRTNEHYTNEEAFKIISKLIESEVVPRSTRLNSSGISTEHPYAIKAKSMGINLYGSPTTSDQAVLSFPSVKIGPGQSARSHSADEYILKSEIFAGIEKHIQLLEGLNLS